MEENVRIPAENEAIFRRILAEFKKDVTRESGQEPVGAELYRLTPGGETHSLAQNGTLFGEQGATEMLKIVLRIDDDHRASAVFHFPAGTNVEALGPLPEKTVARWSRDLRLALTPRPEEPKSDAFETLLNVTRTISSSLSVKEVLHRIVFETLVLFEAKICSLLLLEHDGEELRIETVYGSSLEYIQKPNVPVHNSALGAAVKERRVVRLSDVQTEPGYLHRDLARREGLRSLLAAPLVFQDEVLGVIAVYSSTMREWTDEEATWLDALAGQSAVALRNARLIEQIVQLEESVRRLDRLSVLGELAAGVAHEIRNPLAILSMLAHSLQEEIEPDSEHAQDIHVIADKAEQMNRTLEEMINLARSRPPELVPTNINQVIRDTLLLLAPRVRAGHHDLKLELDESEPEALADAGRLAQVVLNLFLNAADALGRSGRITILTRPERETVLLSVIDNAGGIPEDIRQNLFKPFVTGRREGTGLGLSIVKRIVEDHSGTVQYTTGPKGTRFDIRIPRPRNG